MTCYIRFRTFIYTSSSICTGISPCWCCKIYITTTTGSKVTTVSGNICIDDDGTDTISIGIGVQFDIKLATLFICFNLLVDSDIALSIEFQCCLTITANIRIDRRVDRDAGRLTSRRCLNRHICTFIQDVRNQFGLNPRSRAIRCIGILCLRKRVVVINLSLAAFIHCVNGLIRVTQCRRIILNQDFQRIEQPLTMFPIDAFRIDIEIIAEVQDVAGSLDLAAVDCAAG